MIIERDVPIPVDDGNILRADVFRPADGKPAPVIMTLGPYGKGVRYKDGFAPQVCTFCVFSFLLTLKLFFEASSAAPILVFQWSDQTLVLTHWSVEMDDGHLP